MVGQIKLLSPVIANQIAAGEVVERPASVIKELLENSIDAGAQQITVDVMSGGLTSMRIQDDGAGIAQAELPLSLRRHATSKINKSDDLMAISSLGFRGEALASIASVSKLSITSRKKGESEAYTCKVKGDELTPEVLPAAHPVGTTVEVRDLFYNIPVRRKFLKSAKTEFARIDEIIKKLALSHFDIGFKLSHNHKVLRDFSVAKSEAAQKKRLQKICSKAFINNAYQIHFDNVSDIGLSGYLGTPEAARRQADCQYFFVNGRMVRDRVILHAIKTVYLEHGFSFEGLYPAYVLYLTLPADQVDVNVHPTKHEVRFVEARFIHDFITKCLADTLNQALETAVCTETGEVTKPEYFVKSDIPEKTSQAAPLDFTPKVTKTNLSYQPDRDYKKINNQALEASNALYKATELFDEPQTETTKPLEVIGKAVVDKAPDPQFNNISGFIFQNYYIKPDDEQLMIITLQACKTDIVSLYLSSVATSTSLLSPETLVLTPLQVSLLNKIRPDLQSLGFEIIQNLAATLVLTKVPELWATANLKELIISLLPANDTATTSLSVIVSRLAQSVSIVDLKTIKLTSLVEQWICQHKNHRAIKRVDAAQLADLFAENTAELPL